MECKLISVTPDAEKLMAYCARVSSPSNQGSDNYSKLLAYCLREHHYSVFEMADMCVEITTSRAISTQIVRHKSFSFQEFSQRYAVSTVFEPVEARRQDIKNRQNSIDDLSEETKQWFADVVISLQTMSDWLYKEALDKQIAKECARFLLPLSSQTKLYMKGNVRSWLTYLDIRTGNGTQLEHIRVAEEIRKIFIEQFPTVATAKGWL